jgi:deoxycytidylate deaminase
MGKVFAVGLPMKNERFFKPAKKAAQKAEHYRYYLGAALFYKDKLISTGCNYLSKTHPLCDEDTYGRPVTLHAEVNALIKARDFLNELSDTEKKKLTMVTYREIKNGSRANARPCSGCMAILKQNQIKTILYTIENGYTMEEINE